MTLTFALLGLSICAVWLAPNPIGRHLHEWLWLGLFGGAIASGLNAGFLSAMAIAELGLLGVLSYLAGRAQGYVQHTLYGTSTAVMALALAMHWMPGFNNPMLVADIKFSSDATPFRQFASFDKAAAGLLVLAFLCKRTTSESEWRTMLRRSAPVAVLTVASVMVAAVTFGYVRPDPKLPPYTPVFLATNLLFTCVSEEVFFRGFLQERFARFLGPVPRSQLVVVACSGLLFGLAHAPGGMTYVVLATLSGLGCAHAYAIVQRVEAPIIVHFAVNTVHFVGFTYPRLQ